MHLHEKRCIKRAGEGGIALRAYRHLDLQLLEKIALHLINILEICLQIIPSEELKMDVHIVDFIKSSVVSESRERGLLLWLLINFRNGPKKINQMLQQRSTKKEPIMSERYNYWLRSYKRFEEDRLDSKTLKKDDAKISTLQVNNFRGFNALSLEDKGALVKFHSEINIFFAPNGGGKTSLCEAIEYACTGTIKEAERRKTSVAKYIKRNGKIKLEASAENGDSIKSSSENLFCFIDRNRLQEFSLLGSNDTRFAQRDVLASLVGLEQLDDFFDKLVQPQSFEVSKLKRNFNISKKNNLKREAELSKNKHKEYHKNIGSEISNILSIMKSTELPVRYASSLTKNFLDNFDKRCAFYKEKKERYSKGKLSYIIDDVSIIKFTLHLKKVLILSQRISGRYLALKDEVDYLELYKMAEGVLEQRDFNECPICRTELSEVKVNPLVNVKDCLKRLKSIASLQKRKMKVSSKISKHINFIKEQVELYRKSPLQDESIVSHEDLNYLASLDELDAGSIEKGIAIIEAKNSLSSKIIKHNERCGIHNKAVLESDKVLKRIESNLAKLRGKKSEISGFMDNIRGLKRAVLTESTAIKDIYRQLPLVSQEAARDVEYNSFLDDLKIDYTNLYSEAYRFKKDREQSIISGLNEDIVYYYNKINFHEDDSELIQALDFRYEESIKQYRIIITIQNVAHDAFVSLSEGHLKVLGLSILLALAKKKKLSFIVFDDVVNAIDTEHRSNIVNTFINDEYIKKAQLIVTTHDRFFWEMFSNRCRHDKLDFKSFVLGCDKGSVYILDKKVSFEDKIAESLKYYDVRQALIYCRIWFESLAAKHCVDLSLGITGNFSSRNYQDPNYIKISLESMYDALIKSLNGRDAQVNIIKRSLLNWSVQNQEHHAFNENSYNIVHSKTSHEIKMIYDAIIKFEIQLNPSVKLIKINQRLPEIERQIAKCEDLIKNEKVPDEIKVLNKDKKENLLMKVNGLNDLREFIVSEIFC
ncbi:AAA family ATPase [Pantoea agglomerans]|uniref:AAA family ATPase n=1 Tax=Enterobacter agglomerans TaxID=549 RepID=UPI0013CAE16A|nr:AAA family ATPase [Pantoea agglomerans]NEG62149.1 AAA family ATPase [Pantoea agglomerans]